MENVALTTCTEVLYLPVDSILPNPNQPRRFFDMGPLTELANSILEYGVMQPISVRQVGMQYELVAGERRLRASKLAKMESIPAVIVEIESKDSAFLALIENIQREDLNFIEEAEGFQRLMKDYEFTQDELADKLGKSQSTIANKLRILRLSDRVHTILLENGLTERHARALLKIESEKTQIDILQKVVKHSLNVKNTEDLIEAVIKKSRRPLQQLNDTSEKRCIKDIRIFTNTVKQAVEIMNKSGVETVYDMVKRDDGYEITILVAY